MKQIRRHPSFLREVGLGFLLSSLAAAMSATAAIFVPTASVVYAVVGIVAFAMFIALLTRTKEMKGRILVVAAWLLIVGAAWFLGTGLAAFVAINIVLLWLARTLYVHSSVVEAFLDLGLIFIASAFAVWASLRTDSVLLSYWSFFVVQALYVAIPGACASVFRRSTAAVIDEDSNRRFLDAGRAANEALRRIAQAN